MLRLLRNTFLLPDIRRDVVLKVIMLLVVAVPLPFTQLRDHVLVVHAPEDEVCQKLILLLVIEGLGRLVV